jgi:hypothetical protein
VISSCFAAAGRENDPVKYQRTRIIPMRPNKGYAMSTVLPNATTTSLPTDAIYNRDFAVQHASHIRTVDGFLDHVIATNRRARAMKRAKMEIRRDEKRLLEEAYTVHLAFFAMEAKRTWTTG